MTEFIRLVGAEDVRRAACAISSAARDMCRAAGSIDEALRNHQRFLDDWLQRFEAALATRLEGQDDQTNSSDN